MPGPPFTFKYDKAVSRKDIVKSLKEGLTIFEAAHVGTSHGQNGDHYELPQKG
jgi:hypothetical protein